MVNISRLLYLTYINWLEAVAQRTAAKSHIFVGATGITVSTIIMNNHLQAALEEIISLSVLKGLFISPFTIPQYGLETGVLFREGYIKALSKDLK
jgi:hypothetical protein